MPIEIYMRVKEQLQQLAIEIGKPNNENEHLDYLYRQAFDQGTSLKGEDYGNMVKGFLGSRRIDKDISGENKHERYHPKAQEREAVLISLAKNIAQIIEGAGLDAEQLQKLQQQTIKHMAQLKAAYSYPATQGAIDRIYHPIIEAINTALQLNASAKFSM